MDVTMVPSSDGSQDNIGQSPAWSRIDDDPAASDGTAINTTNKGSDAFHFFGLSDLETGETYLPIMFESMDAVDIQWRCRWFTFTDDDAELYVQMFEADEVTPLSNEVLATARTSIPSSGATGTAALTGVIAGTKAQWDTAMLRFRLVYVQNMGGDGGDFQIDALRMFGTYTSNSTIFPMTLTGGITPGGSQFEMAVFESWGVSPSAPVSWAGKQGMFSTMRRRDHITLSNEEGGLGESDGIWEYTSLDTSGLNYKIDCAIADWYTPNATYLVDGGNPRAWVANGAIYWNIAFIDSGHPEYTETVVGPLPDGLAPWQRLVIFCEWNNNDASNSSEIFITIYDDWEGTNPQQLFALTGEVDVRRRGSKTKIAILSMQYDGVFDGGEPGIVFRARGENQETNPGVQFDIEFNNPVYFPRQTPREGSATVVSDGSGTVLAEVGNVHEPHARYISYNFHKTHGGDDWPILIPFFGRTDLNGFGRAVETRLDAVEHFADLDVTERFWSLGISFAEVIPVDWAFVSGLFGNVYDEAKAALYDYYQDVETFLIAKGYAFEPHVWLGVDNNGFSFFEVGNGVDSVRVTSSVQVVDGEIRTLVLDRTADGIVLHDGVASVSAAAPYEQFPLDSSRDWQFGNIRGMALNTVAYWAVDSLTTVEYTSTSGYAGIMERIEITGPATISGVDFSIRPGFAFPPESEWIVEFADSTRSTLLGSSIAVAERTGEYPEWNRLTLQTPVFIDTDDPTLVTTIYICVRNVDSSAGQIALTTTGPARSGVHVQKSAGNIFFITELGRQNGATVLTPVTTDEVIASNQTVSGLALFLRVIGTSSDTDFPPPALTRWFALFNDHVLDPINRDNLLAYDGLTAEPVELNQSTFYFNAADLSNTFINEHDQLPNLSDQEPFPGVQRVASAQLSAIGSFAGTLTNQNQEGVGFLESNIDVAGPWAISLFVSLDDVANGMQAIAISGSPIGRDDASIGVNSAGDWVGRIFDSSAGVVVGAVIGPKAVIGQRLHLAYEWDAVNEEAILFINGKEHGRTSALGFVFTSGRHFLRVGRAAGGLDTPLLADEVAYYDHAPGRSHHRHVALRGFGNGRLIANAVTQAPVLEPVGNSLDAQWQILVPTNVDFDMIWALGGAVSVPLEALWDVTVPVFSSVEALWDNLVVIATPVDLGALWSLEAHVAGDLDAQWNVLETPRLPPDAILSQTNLSGVVEDIQDDTQGPDADWLEAVSDSSASDLLVSFPTPGSRLAYGYGANVQEVQALVRRSRESGNAPQVRVTLFEGGVDLGISTLVTLNTDVGEVVSIFFDAEDLVDPTGADLELRVEGVPSADQ